MVLVKEGGRGGVGPKLFGERKLFVMNSHCSWWTVTVRDEQFLFTEKLNAQISEAVIYEEFFYWTRIQVTFTRNIRCCAQLFFSGGEFATEKKSFSSVARNKPSFTTRIFHCSLTLTAEDACGQSGIFMRLLIIIVICSGSGRFLLDPV